MLTQQLAAGPVPFSIEWPAVWEKIQSESHLAWEKCKALYYHHSDLLSQLTTFSLNTLFFASKIVQKIPPLVPRLANTALSFTGLLYLNMQIRELIKVGGDLINSIKAKEVEGIVFTACRVAVKALNILLGLSFLAATLVTLCGFPAAAIAMYGIMRPFALFSFLVGIGLEVYDFQKNEALLRQFRKIEQQPEKVSKIAKALEKLIKKETTKSECPKEELRLAFHTFRQLEHFHVEILHEELTKEKSPEKNLLEKIKVAFEQKNLFTQANLGLISLGYVCMGICKIWPDTLIQSAATWGISLLYTGKLIYQKIKQTEWGEAAPD